MLAATLFTLFVVPVAYDLLARRTGSPGDTKRRLEEESARQPSEKQPDEGAEAAGGSTS